MCICYVASKRKLNSTVSNYNKREMEFIPPKLDA